MYSHKWNIYIFTEEHIGLEYFLLKYILYILLLYYIIYYKHIFSYTGIYHTYISILLYWNISIGFGIILKYIINIHSYAGCIIIVYTLLDMLSIYL